MSASSSSLARFFSVGRPLLAHGVDSCGGRADADVGRDQRLLELVPERVVEVVGSEQRSERSADGRPRARQLRSEASLRSLDGGCEPDGGVAAVRDR